MATFATQYRGVEQLVARRAHNPEVVGSSPASATRSSSRNGFRYDYFFVLIRSPIKNLKVFVRFPIFNSLIGEGGDREWSSSRFTLHMQKETKTFSFPLRKDTSTRQ